MAASSRVSSASRRLYRRKAVLKTLRLLAAGSPTSTVFKNSSITSNQESNDMTSRRTFIKDASLLALATMAPFQSVFAAGKTTVGVIYVGARGHSGYNQAQASAAAIS